jgi:hypothetical protein
MTNLYFSLAIYTALAIALGFGLWLYFSVQKQIASLRKEIASRGEYSTTDRQRILERYRAGDDAAKIAASLKLPRNEVELTLELARFTAN